MNRMFINRKEELEFLEKKYRGKNFNFIVIYGRRRVGKTELIKQFVKDKSHIYFLSDKRGTEINVDRFKEKVSEFLGEPKVELTRFEEIFKYLLKKTEGKKLVVCIDEFSYLIEKDNSIPSVFQLIIDETLAKTNSMLILSGSSVSLMEKGVLSSKSPLYGRRTGQFKIEPLSFDNASKFFPKYDLKEAITIYSVFSGVPYYLQKVDDSKTVLDNIRDLLLKKGEILFEEVDFLLKEELREPATYKSILEAIAAGCSKIVEIANKTKIQVQDLDKYLKVLINLGYVEKQIPVTNKLKSKKTIYLIKDNFFRFWFKFCFPKSSELEMGDIEKIMKFIKQDLNSYVGRVFEDICRYFIKKNDIFKFDKMGNWWGFWRNKEGKRKDFEIDICGVNEKTKEILFGECKWKEKVNALSILNELKEKTKHVQWENEKRKESYAIFAVSFSKKVGEFEGKKVYCFDLRDIEKVLKR